MKNELPRRPYTHEELDQMLSNLRLTMKEIESSVDYEVRPIPPLTYLEAVGMFNDFICLACTRKLTPAEGTLLGQLLAVFEHAVRAETLGHKCRYFVVSEEHIAALSKRG